MGILNWINECNLFEILLGIIACFIASAFKPLIKKGITAYQEKQLQKADSNNQETYNEKWYSGVVSVYCTLIIAVVSVIGATLWDAFYLGINNFYAYTNFYFQILSIISTAKLVYMAYEGVGNISLKQLVKDIISRITSKTPDSEITKFLNQNSEQIADIVDSVLPLTETGRKELLKAFESKSNTKEDEIVDTTEADAEN